LGHSITLLNTSSDEGAYLYQKGIDETIKPDKYSGTPLGNVNYPPSTDFAYCSQSRFEPFLDCHFEWWGRLAPGID
jgi:hypothetical protein